MHGKARDVSQDMKIDKFETNSHWLFHFHDMYVMPQCGVAFLEKKKAPMYHENNLMSMNLL